MAAEAVAKTGYTGEIVVIGDEPHMPYNRPPLSKAALHSTPDVAALTFRVGRAAQAVQWRLGARVIAADLEAHTVTLSGGETLDWDGLVIASGLRPRTLSVPGPIAGRHVIRTHDDAGRLRSAMLPGSRMVIVGAGFIGCEVAATARTLGLAVDVVAPEAVPMQRPLQLALGAALQRRHEAHGVRFHLGVVPTALGGADTVSSASLNDGSELAADLVVEAVGCAPNVEWLEGNGLELSDGVLCDNLLRVGGRPDVVACGDVTKFPNLLFDDVPRRVEHWTMVTDTGKRAGLSLGSYLTGNADSPAASGEIFAPMPSFWSDQYDLRIQSFGAVGLGGDDVRILEGDLDDEVAVGYHRDRQLVGVVLIGLSRRHSHYRELVAAGASVAHQEVTCP